MKRVSESRLQLFKHALVLIAIAMHALLPAVCLGETYGLKDSEGNFVPRINVTVTDREVVIKKVDPQDKFRSFSLVLNPKNQNLIRNVGQIKLEWIDPTNKPGRPVQFAGPLYNANTRVFQDSMIRSLGIKLIDSGNRRLFASKSLSDLFTLNVDDQHLLSSEAVSERDRTVQMKPGKDVSINIDKTSIVFNESNFKKGEIINVDNRSGMEQVLGVEIPEKGTAYAQIVKKPNSPTSKVPRENWDRFSVDADAGAFIVLIPDRDPQLLAQLDGKEIIIRIYQGLQVRETRKIPIKVSADLKAGAVSDHGDSRNPSDYQQSRTPETTGSAKGSSRSDTSGSESRKVEQKVNIWLWIMMFFNLVIVGGAAVYVVFIALPKLQVIEDRLSKTEIFIHGSREAIREELDQIKKDVLQECRKDLAQE